MGILNTKLEEVLKSFSFFKTSKKDGWVKWIAQDNDWKDDCDKFHGCYFYTKQMPHHPQHLHCQCRLERINKPIPYFTASANVDIRKFTEYIFSETNNNGKKALFEKWGFTISDSTLLQQHYIQQSLQKYCNGDYIFKDTGQYYPRIEIAIDLPTKNGQAQQIKTGWILCPNGEIRLSTPFTGFVN